MATPPPNIPTPSAGNGGGGRPASRPQKPYQDPTSSPAGRVPGGGADAPDPFSGTSRPVQQQPAQSPAQSAPKGPASTPPTAKNPAQAGSARPAQSPAPVAQENSGSASVQQQKGQVRMPQSGFTPPELQQQRGVQSGKKDAAPISIQGSSSSDQSSRKLVLLLIGGVAIFVFLAVVGFLGAWFVAG